jgi:hypothetical protein
MTSPIIIIVGLSDDKYIEPFIKEIDIALQQIDKIGYKSEIICYPLSHNIDYETLSEEYIIIGHGIGCSLALTMSCHIKTLKVFLVNPIYLRFSAEFIEALSPLPIRKKIGQSVEEKEVRVYESPILFLYDINELCHNLMELYNGIVLYPVYHDETENLTEIVCDDFYRLYRYAMSYRFGLSILGAIWDMAVSVGVSWILAQIYYGIYGGYKYLKICNMSSDAIRTTVYEHVAKPDLYDLIEECPCPIDIIQDDMLRANICDLIARIRRERVEEEVFGKDAVKNDVNISYMTGGHDILYFFPRQCAERIIDSLL